MNENLVKGEKYEIRTDKDIIFGKKKNEADIFEFEEDKEKNKLKNESIEYNKVIELYYSLKYFKSEYLSNIPKL